MELLGVVQMFYNLVVAMVLYDSTFVKTNLTSYLKLVNFILYKYFNKSHLRKKIIDREKLL